MLCAKMYKVCCTVPDLAKRDTIPLVCVISKAESLSPLCSCQQQKI